MVTTRRRFLKTTATGALAGGAMAAGIRADLAADTVVDLFDRNAAATRARGATPGSMSPEQRRQLVARATFGPKETVTTKGGLMICRIPLATPAGGEAMRAGGNAADAVLAAAVTQTVVEPHMCGITGVFSMLYFDAKAGKTDYINGGVNAPMAKLGGGGCN